MADEKRYTIALSISEAALIRLIRSVHGFCEIRVTKANGEIARVTTNEMFMIKDILNKFSMDGEKKTNE